MNINEFEFISYKIDEIELKLDNKIQNLLSDSASNSYIINFSLLFRNALRIEQENKFLYLSGIGLVYTIKNTNNKIIGKGKIGLEGVFSSPIIDYDAQLYFVKDRIPAILFPYLRTALTTILSQAGIGSYTLPLINISALAHDADIKIIENQ